MMEIGKLYYLKLDHENKEHNVATVVKVIDIFEGNVECASLETKKRIVISNYDDCENIKNEANCYVTIRTITKEKNPEYFL